jgi:hypothetical protein
VELSVIIPLVIATVALAFFYTWYRRKIADLKPDSESRSFPGARLTAERLRDLSSPPWRVVYEISERHLGPVDHVVIGPTGVIAIETLMLDRPQTTEGESNAQLTATAAIERGDVDDITRSVGVPCDLLAKVYWGAAQPEVPAAIQVTTGQVAVDGHRLVDWLVALPPGPLSGSQIDQVWQAVTTGVGRPDPLT